MRVLLRVLLLGVIATATTTSMVAAQPAAPVDKTRVAKQYVDAGLAAQSSGDYDTAIEFYSKAYQLVRHPLLIFNMAQAHRLAGRIDVALRLYARYLQEDPNGAQAKNVHDIVAEIEAQRAADARKADDARRAEDARKLADVRKADDARKLEEARKAEQARKLADVRKADDARKLEEARTADEAHKADDARKPDDARKLADVHPADAAQPGSVQAPPPPLTDEPPAPGRTLRLAGLSAGAAGVVGLGLGIGFGLHARSLSSELSRPGAQYSQSKYDAGQRANTIAITGLVGGAVLVAAGAAVYWWGHVEGEHADRVTLAPLLSDHFAGLAAVGTLP